MKETDKYYSIRFLEGNAYHSKDDLLKTSDNVLNIGETPDCPIRYDSKGYEPEYYATIIKNEDGDGWRIVKRSQYIDVQIAGNGGFGYVHQLKDGDIISFGEEQMSLMFNLHQDSEYSKVGLTIVHESNHKLLYIIAALVAIVVAGVGFLFYEKWRTTDLQKEVKKYSSSVYVIMADSVQYVSICDEKEELIRPTKDLKYSGQREIGTAFLTSDKKLITARHCIEFWLNTKIDKIMDVSSLDPDDVTRWAIEAETFMQEHEDSQDTIKVLKVFCSVYSQDSLDIPKFVFHSLEPRVHINRMHDAITTVPDINYNYYWRTIVPEYKDREMELGDISYIDVDEQGNIELADSVQMSRLTEGTPIGFLGYPQNGIGDRRLTYENGNITRDIPKNCITQNLYVKGGINPGFSGGPVFTMIENDVVAIGVVSRVDSISNGIYKWVVPISEIEHMNKRKEEVR